MPVWCSFLTATDCIYVSIEIWNSTDLCGRGLQSSKLYCVTDCNGQRSVSYMKGLAIETYNCGILYNCGIFIASGSLKQFHKPAHLHSTASITYSIGMWKRHVLIAWCWHSSTCHADTESNGFDSVTTTEVTTCPQQRQEMYKCRPEQVVTPPHPCPTAHAQVTLNLLPQQMYTCLHNCVN